MLQDTFLFDGTIRENVAFARPDAREDEILAACRIARVDEFAEGFENKYETVVGERGVKLSVGEKQRVSVARALLKTVAELREHGKCIVFSTHIMREAEKLCDRIAIIHRGSILAEGKLAELCDRRYTLRNGQLS